ncbi:hypothetical protein ACFU98_30495 [Streptomyces sp. NPDC057575]
MNESTACLVRRHELFADELGAYTCHRCTERIDGHLLALAGPRACTPA